MIIPKNNRRTIYENLFKGLVQTFALDILELMVC